MSWSPDLYIGEMRPWPDSVHVVRGKTAETRRYFPERKDGQEALERRIDELCAEVERLRQLADGAAHEADRLTHDAAALQIENAKLREFASEAFSMAFNFYHGAGTAEDLRELTVEYRELGIEAGK